MSENAAVTYASYLKLGELLDLQSPRSNTEHDEMLFIIIHQVYELWFKQCLHELDYLQLKLRQNDDITARHTLNRILTILKTVVAQIDVLETMTPLEFNAFRSYLDTASGFQSAQFREMEFVLGYKRRNMLNHFPEDSSQYAHLEQRYQQPTLWDAFLQFLSVSGYPVPDDLLKRDVTASIEPSEELQHLLVDIYRTDARVAQVCERLVDLDEGLQEWRYRHIKMVERTIGNKPGTGGSSGVRYLQSTLHPLFPDLWAIRTKL